MTDALDGRLPPSERPDLDEHLRACAACRREWEGYSEVRRVLLATGTEKAPAALAGRISAAVRAAGERATSPPSWWSHIGRLGFIRVAATLVAMAFVVSILMEEGPWKAGGPTTSPEASRPVAEAREKTAKHLVAADDSSRDRPEEARDETDREVAETVFRVAPAPPAGPPAAAPAGEPAPAPAPAPVPASVAAPAPETEKGGGAVDALASRSAKDRRIITVDPGAEAYGRAVQAQMLRRFDQPVMAAVLRSAADPRSATALSAVFQVIQDGDAVPAQAGHVGLRRLAEDADRAVAGDPGPARAAGAASNPEQGFAAKEAERQSESKLDASIRPSAASGSVAPGSADRIYALSGSQAVARLRTFLSRRGVTHRELDLLPVSQADQPVGPPAFDPEPAGKPVRQSYALFEVTVPADAAVPFIGDLESLPGLTLRVTNPTRWSTSQGPVPGDAGARADMPGAAAAKDRGQVRMAETFVVVVLDS